jgi:hypothetical protein
MSRAIRQHISCCEFYMLLMMELKMKREFEDRSNKVSGQFVN